MAKVIQKFLEQVLAIFRKKPTYRQPGDGSDGTCDCIGLIIGAIRRMGLKWTGIHGCNWAARKEFVQLKPIKQLTDLSIGDVVLKAYDPNHSKWNLPSRYKQGGSYYNGDMKDYYHAGVVTSTYPLVITHMTSPTVRQDTTETALKKWTHYGTLKILARAAGESTGTPVETVKPQPVQETPVTATPATPATGKRAVVTAESGRYVKMRAQPSTGCRLYDEVPVGAEVTLEQPGETWAKISYGRRKGWYMMAKFLDVKE